MSSHFYPDMSRDEFDAAVSEARAEGLAEGQRDGDKRVAAVVSKFSVLAANEQLAADSKLMSAALKLATTSDMAGDDIAEFVTKNVKPFRASSNSPAALENRMKSEDFDPLAIGGFLQPAAADGWKEAIDRAAGNKATGK